VDLQGVCRRFFGLFRGSKEEGKDKTQLKGVRSSPSGGIFGWNQSFWKGKVVKLLRIALKEISKTRIHVISLEKSHLLPEGDAGKGGLGILPRMHA